MAHAIESPAWRILTWNLHGSARPDLDAVAAVVRDLRPDAVAVQEIRRNQAADLGRRLGWRHHWGRKHSPYGPLTPWLDEGMAIMTSHGLADPVRRSITPGVSTWTFRHRIVLAGTIIRNADRLRLYDVHLASGDAVDERIAQADRVAALAIAEQPAVRVVAGDLNAPDEPEVVRALHPAGVRDPGGGPTNPALVPRQRLDYVLVPDGAEVTSRVEVDGGEDWAVLSDHLPVLVEFRCAPSSDAAPSR